VAKNPGDLKRIIPGSGAMRLPAQTPWAGKNSSALAEIQYTSPSKKRGRLMKKGLTWMNGMNGLKFYPLYPVYPCSLKRGGDLIENC